MVSPFLLPRSPRFEFSQRTRLPCSHGNEPHESFILTGDGDLDDEVIWREYGRDGIAPLDEQHTVTSGLGQLQIVEFSRRAEPVDVGMHDR